VLDFLSATDVGRLVPPLAEEGDAVSEVSEWELRERREREEEREAEAEALGAEDEVGAGRTPAVPSHPLVHGLGWRGVGDWWGGLSFAFSFVISLVRFIFLSRDRPGRRAKGSLQRAAIARTAAGNRSKCTPP